MDGLSMVFMNHGCLYMNSTPDNSPKQANYLILHCLHTDIISVNANNVIDCSKFVSQKI